MNKCETLNLTIQRLCNKSGGLLPPEYQQVEYLQCNNGNSYIATSVPLKSTYYLEVQYMIISPYKASLFGSLTTTYPLGSYSIIVGQMLIASNKKATVPKTENVIYNLIAYYDSGTSSYRCFIDGTETSYVSDSGNTANNGFSLFKSNWQSSYYAGSGRIYHVLIKESINGDTTLDFYPCYRKSDNKPGMYDLVTNTFYTNAGTGEFTVGADV